MQIKLIVVVVVYSRPGKAKKGRLYTDYVSDASDMTC